jgi:hypothetical protein
MTTMTRKNETAVGASTGAGVPLVAAVTLVAVVTLVGLPLAAQRTARMALPEDLAARVERLSATGFGGRSEGHYTLGDLSGEFTRVESRWAIADPLYAQNRGRSSFTLDGPGFDAPVAGTCEMRRGTVTLGVITFDPEKMNYHCDLHGAGAAADGSLVLGEPKPENLRARMLARADRRGEATFGDVTIEIRSVHHYSGSRLQSSLPVGYLFEMDGRAIGALELTDVDPAVYLPADAGATPAAMVVSALALAVLRDPASSALEE